MVDKYFVPDADPFEYKNELLQTLAEVARLANENSALRLQLKQRADQSDVRDAALGEAAQKFELSLLERNDRLRVGYVCDSIRALKSKRGGA
ncbi:hypothetical protein [Robbsia andropogonis]|uniref:hypothetical protein n=1 Tax=Robbsia andropogonis TaxID=28092 RepID=UPI00209D8E65|nr:hypothetical protein [Robbsia andropogonis]MCP1118885.1 hypothetical protein [Robbsia andropogonis]MCP1128352.1 hypothetical protein [Robbsia andropogonis]